MIMQDFKDISDYKLNLRERIPDVALQLFTERGINAVRMDDVAQTMGISKRTIYELYDKKEDLLFEVVVKHFKMRMDRMEEAVSNCDNVMEILLEVYHMKVADFKSTNPLFFLEMVRYPLVKRFLDEQNELMRDHSLAFIQRGVEEGYFRSDLNFQMSVLQFDAMGEYIMQKELYRQYSIEDIFRNLVFVSLRGLCTDKGIKAIDEMLFG